ncbi:MAG: chromosome segregation protein SMC [Clostridia bacterium]|nr:chromosome segregation protein SMC [Clostridia bacterium]
MYLKSLEISGFKSFPDKTEIKFGKGITSIVGPNGSGKSNISDAIRWVLGEQSTKTLRGSRMEDVIFSGTPIRKGSGYAEVALTIDNSEHYLPVDYDEVIIARRYYRSGESDYFINRKIVRLKDVNELLMNTGLGRDGYSMIGQGRIDEVLSVRSADRRGMFEEAAGISKYKYRKEETEKKLSATDENLVRINDIIAEVEGRYAPLEKKAEKARSYLLLRDELRGLEIGLWADDLREIREKSAKNEKDYNLASFQLEEARIASDKAYAAAESIAEEMRLLSVEEEAKRAEIRTLEAERAEFAGELSSLETAIRLTKENVERVRSELASGRDRRAEIEKAIAEQEEKIAAAAGEKETLTGKAAEKRAELDRIAAASDAKDAHTASLRADAVEKRLAASVHRSASEAAERDARAAAERREALGTERARISEALDEQKTRTAESEEKIRGAKEELEELTNLLSGYRLRYESRKKKADASKEKLDRAAEERNAAVSRRNLLADMQRDYEGFNQAVRALMREKRRGTVGGIHGTVAELSHTEKTYAVALETALGGALQNIVTDDEESAKRAIRYLQSANAGRATFLPLTAIRPYRLNETGLERETGYIGVASDLLRTEKRYESIVSNLLGRTVVADNIDDAVRMARSRGYRFRVVTLDGQLVNQGGSLTGGSLARSGGILSRANELEELEKKIEESRSLIDTLTEEYKKAAKELDGLSYQIEAGEEDVRKNKNVLLEEETRIESEKKLLAALEERVDGADREIAELSGREKERLADREREEKLAAESLAEAERIEKEAEKLQSELSDTGSEAGAIASELAAISEKIAALEASAAELQNGKTDLERILAGAADAVAGQEKLFDEAAGSIAENEEKRASVLVRMEEKDGEIEKENESLRLLGETRLGREAERSKAEKTAREKNDEIVELEKECQRLEMRRTNLAEDEDRITRNLWENYEMTPAEADKTIGGARLPEKSKVGSRVGELRGRIRALGEIDVGAIDEFKEVKARFEELTAQRSDIEKSKEELVAMIEDVTGEMRRLFEENFRLLNEYFNESFVEIFGGGSAALVLDDPNELLTSGIEIVVKLPGKNLRTISLLSGGEKAFVAIALYFAILKTRPTPFCVLDEIEAALDDTNVYRFARYMRKLSEKTQFIVITHRRGTMEESDILYGVTMQEAGVSKLLIMDMAKLGDWDEEKGEIKNGTVR